MPELPEVEAVVCKLKPAVEHARIHSVKVLRPRATHPQPPRLIEQAIGHTIRAVERRGKNILVHLSRGLVIKIHLRMTGNVTLLPSHLLHSDTVRVVLALEDGRGIAYEDRRMLGSVTLHQEAELPDLLRKVGVDPLSADFTLPLLTDAAQRSRKPAKVFLMDQHPVAGLGNIYVAESLFQARIHPARPACDISRKKLSDLHAAIRDVLTKAIPEAMATYSQPGRHDGMHWSVYDREGQPCYRCSRPVLRMKQASRSTYYCGSCQK